MIVYQSLAKNCCLPAQRDVRKTRINERIRGLASIAPLAAHGPMSKPVEPMSKPASAMSEPALEASSARQRFFRRWIDVHEISDADLPAANPASALEFAQCTPHLCSEAIERLALSGAGAGQPGDRERKDRSVRLDQTMEPLRKI